MQKIPSGFQEAAERQTALHYRDKAASTSGVGVSVIWEVASPVPRF